MESNKNTKPSATQVVKEIKRRTRRVFTADAKIQIVLEGLRGEESIAARKGTTPVKRIVGEEYSSVKQIRFEYLYLFGDMNGL
ncbi:hypothetical protein ACFLS7_06375 [Bacteroidota bacterium]